MSENPWSKYSPNSDSSSQSGSNSAGANGAGGASSSKKSRSDKTSGGSLTQYLIKIFNLEEVFGGGANSNNGNNSENGGDDSDNDAKNIAKLVLIGFVAVFTVWVLSGIYVVEPDEQAIVTRFGKYVGTTQSGLRYHLPMPIESARVESVTSVRVTRVGFGGWSASHADGEKARLSESLMLTGDENIVDMQFEVQWKISNLQNYVFKVSDPVQTVSDVSQSVIREIVANSTLVTILTNGRAHIEQEAKELIQNILNEYNSGIEILLVQMLRADPPSQVIDAFRDVQNARVDKESLINLAMLYRNDVLPRARGEAQKIIQDAEAYASESVDNANGSAKRFNDIYAQYKNAPYVTRKRIYLDTMESLYGNTNKTIVGKNVHSSGMILSISDAAESGASDSSQGQISTREKAAKLAKEKANYVAANSVGQL